LGQLAGLDGSEATRYRAEARQTTMGVMQFHDLAVKVSQAVIDTPKTKLDPIETDLDVLQSGFDTLQPRLDPFQPGLDALQPGFRTSLHVDKPLHLGWKVEQLIREHMPTKLGPPLRVLGEKLNQVVEIFDGERH
jgi:hypothetical protein